MKDCTTDKVQGAAHETKGAVKEQWARDEQSGLEAEGNAERIFEK